MLDADKERERRRKRYKFALVRYEWPYQGHGVEYKQILNSRWARDHTILCDDQPEKVLRGMLKLLEDGDG